MDVQLNNGTMVSGVTPDDLKRMSELGLIGKSSITTNGYTTLTEERRVPDCLDGTKKPIL